MKTILLALAAAAIAVAPAAAAPRLHGEAQLAKMIEGRAPGKPVDCIDLSLVRSSTIVDGTAIVWDTGRTLYVNRPRAGAESMASWDTMLIKPFDRRLCRIDIVELFDNGARLQKGTVFLDDFVPYERVDAHR